MNERRKKKASPSDVSDKFKVVFLSVVCMSILTLVLSIILSFQNQLSPYQQQLFEACTTSWKMGFGAVMGMLGIKTI